MLPSTPSVAPIFAQTVITVDSSTSCKRCTLTVERVAELGRVDAPDLLGMWSAVALGPRGRFYVVTTKHPGLVIVFDPSGSLSDSIRAVPPARPMTSDSWNTRVFGTADSVFILDPKLLQLSVMDDRLRLTRQRRLPHSRIYALLVSGEIVTTGGAQGPATVGQPLHVYLKEGTLRSFGNPDARPWSRRTAQWFERGIVPSRTPHQFWSNHHREFSMSLWDINGKMLLELRGAPEWFTWSGDQAKAPGETEPRPWLTDIMESDDSSLQTLTLVADRRWKPGWDIDMGPRQEHHARDAVISVVNMNTGAILAVLHHDRAFRGFIDSETLFAMAEDHSGRVYMEIWRLRRFDPR